MRKYANGTPHVPVEDPESPAAAPDAFNIRKNHVSGITAFCFHRLLPRNTPEARGESSEDPPLLPLLASLRALSLCPLFFDAGNVRRVDDAIVFGEVSLDTLTVFLILSMFRGSGLFGYRIVKGSRTPSVFTIDREIRPRLCPFFQSRITS